MTLQMTFSISKTMFGMPRLVASSTLFSMNMTTVVIQLSKASSSTATLPPPARKTPLLTQDFLPLGSEAPSLDTKTTLHRALLAKRK